MTGKNLAWLWSYRITIRQISKAPCQREWPKNSLFGITVRRPYRVAIVQSLQGKHDWHKPSLWRPLLPPRQAHGHCRSPHSRPGIPRFSYSSQSGWGFLQLLPSAECNQTVRQGEDSLLPLEQLFVMILLKYSFSYQGLPDTKAIILWLL